MFRTPAAFVLVSALSAGAIADTVPGFSPLTSQHADGSHSGAVIREHVEAQLDWRSYYLNRFAAGRSDSASGRDNWSHIPGARPR